MADVVQYRMERMVDELDDLERRGLFTRREIDEIVRKRRDYEFRLKRHSPLKEDFVAYIEFEKQLVALRNLRKRSIIGKLREERKREEEEEEEEQEGGDGEGSKKRKRNMRVNKGGKLWKRSISDVAGVLRILDIYRKVTTRYKGDLELWFKYLEFCREQRHGTMKKVLVQAIRYHPKVPGLWMYAAAWEFDHNLNVAAARALMQSGLRTCPESEDMWIEYLRMELTYLNKLKARKVALGEDVKTLTQNSGKEEESKKWKEENKESFMPLSEEKEGSEGVEQHEVALEKKENFFWEQGSNILRTIYHGAAEALPSSMSLRKRFLEILDEVDLAHSDELKEEVMEELRKNFSKDESFWDWFAKFQLHDADLGKNSEKGEVICMFKKALQVYEDALKILPSTKMFSLYGKFLYDAVIPEANVSSVLNDTVMDDKELSMCLLKVYERAESSGCLTKELAHQYVSLHLHLGRLEEARDLAGRLCDGNFSHISKLWCLRISIEMKWLTKEPASVNDTECNSVFKLLRSALANLSLQEAETLWFMALKLFSEQKDHLKKLIDCSLMALARSGGDSVGYSVPSAIVNRIFQREGIQRARETYKRFLALPHPSALFFRDCIALESNLALVGDKIGLVNARKLYDSALSLFPHIKELWKSYYDMEIKIGTAETVNAVHWRARKALGDTTGLSSSDYL